jgi:hypothetical protein
MQSRYFSSRSTLWDENSPTTHGSYTASQEATKSAVPSSKPDHIMSAPTIARNTWSKYKYDPVVPAGDTESSDMRFRIPKAGHAVFMPPSRLDVSDVSGIRGQKRQLWATQTMQDVISPKAFEQWTKDQTIPKTPDDMWSASDMRKAYTFKKRQWKLSKPEFKHLKLDTVPSIASRKQPRQKDASGNQQSQGSAARPTREDADELPPSTDSKLQAQLRARARVLNEAFRGLLSPAQQRRAVLHKGSSLSDDSHVSEILLTKRIMSLIKIYGPGSSRDRVYELLDGQSFPVLGKSLDEFVLQFSKWKTAAEELKEAVEMKWPGESKRNRMKVVIEQEMEEIRGIEKTVHGIVAE